MYYFWEGALYNKKTFFIALFVFFSLTLTVFCDTQKVYFTASGKKYHVISNCRALSRSKNIKEGTLQEAKEHGLKPCKFCCQEE